MQCILAGAFGVARERRDGVHEVGGGGLIVSMFVLLFGGIGSSRVR